MTECSSFSNQFTEQNKDESCVSFTVHRYTAIHRQQRYIRRRGVKVARYQQSTGLIKYQDGVLFFLEHCRLNNYFIKASKTISLAWVRVNERFSSINEEINDQQKGEGVYTREKDKLHMTLAGLYPQWRITVSSIQWSVHICAVSELLLNPRAAGSRAREDLCIKHQYQYHHLSDTEARDKHTVRESVMLIFKSAEGEKHTQTAGAQMCVGESLAALFTFRWTNTLTGQRCRDFH